MQTFANLAEFKAQLGQEIGVSSYKTIDQATINAFAEATGDKQWIHINEEMAKQYSPFKTTIAHGFLTLSLAPMCMYEIYAVKSVKMGVNYGTNKVRFTSVVPAGSNVRMRASLAEVEDVPNNGLKITMNCVFEVEGQAKPACVAELISVMYE
jgi:acyl dehydratase